MTKDEALAFDLALEALESCTPADTSTGHVVWPSYDEQAVKQAITAIKQVRALDKMAENARELGLDYEPVAPVQEDWGPGPHECHSLTAAPVQEPVAWRYRGILHDFDPSDWAEGPVTPLYTTPPAQPAPVQERNFCERCGKRLGSGIHTCTPPAAPVQERFFKFRECEDSQARSDHTEDNLEMVAPPVQEPVAYLCENAVGHKYFRWKKPSSEYKPIALYTTPPAAQRQWVGLTDEDISAAYEQMPDYEMYDEFARAIEAKLKEKNT